MQLLVLDLETYFDASYSLKNSDVSTESYVRDPQFKIHMIGYYLPALMGAPADCLPGLLEPGQSLRQEIENSAVLCHHAHFDLLALNHWHGIRPKFILDTLPMARLVLPKLKSHSLEALAQHFGLPAKNVPYNLFKSVRNLSAELYAFVAEGCRHDVWLTHQIFLRLLPLVPKEELQVIDSTICMFSEPVLQLDRPRMEKFLLAERMRKAKAMLEAGRALGMNINLSGIDAEARPTMLRHLLDHIETELQSSAKFQIALESIGYRCPMKWSEKQQIEIPALAKNDDGMKELLEHDDPRVSTLAAARLGVKSTIDETRSQRLLETDSRGALPIYLSYAAAKTLRFGGGDKTNWQNFRRGGEIRKSVVAPEGHKLVIGDLSQIEYRLLLWLTGQTDKLAALAMGVDLYCEFATEFYGEPITKADVPRRGVGKQGILMGGYGAGRGTMIATAAGGGYGPPVYLSDAEGQRMVDLYRGGHPCVLEFWKWCEKSLPILANGGERTYDARNVIRIADHKIHLPNGTWIDYTGLKWATNIECYPDQEPDGEGYSWWEPSRKGWSRTWGSHVTADIIQALACVVIKQAMVKAALRYKIALQVHDELVLVVPDAQAKEAGDWLYEMLVTPPAWCADIPLEAEITIAGNYDK